MNKNIKNKIIINIVNILFVLAFPIIWIVYEISLLIKTILQSGKKAKEGEHNT